MKIYRSTDGKTEVFFKDKEVAEKHASQLEGYKCEEITVLTVGKPIDQKYRELCVLVNNRFMIDYQLSEIVKNELQKK